MESISTEIGKKTDFENLIQACLLTDAPLPHVKNTQERAWLTDYLNHTAEKFSGIVKRIESYGTSRPNNENGEMCRLTEDLIGKILWLDHSLPEALDEEEKALLNRLLIRDELRETPLAISWNDISVADLQTMKMRDIITSPEYHYYLGRIAYSEAFDA